MQIASPQSREISRECQKLKKEKKRTKVKLSYYTKNLKRHVKKILEKLRGALINDTNTSAQETTTGALCSRSLCNYVA